MEPRKKQTKPATAVPKDFLKTVSALFNEQFEKTRGEALFTSQADLYMDEVIACVSLTKPGNVRAVSIYLSLDLPKNLANNAEKVSDKLKSMVDIAASWFNESFSEKTSFEELVDKVTEYEAKWQELVWEKEKFFVKLNHDNRVLEKAAEQFLEEKKSDQTKSDPKKSETASAEQTLQTLAEQKSQEKKNKLH